MAAQGPMELGPARNDSEITAFMKVASEALMFADADLDAWAEREGKSLMRVARRDGCVLGGWVAQPMGIFFGGRSIPMAAVRVVGVAPEHRSSGVASAMMFECIKEARRNHMPLAGLYPATQPVYRKAGYEQAGVRIQYRVPTHLIDPLDRGLKVRPVEERDQPAIKDLYRRFAVGRSGHLDRTDWYWGYIFDPPPWRPKSNGYLVERDGQVDGYAFFGTRKGEWFHDTVLDVKDILAATRESAVRLLTLFADYRSVASHVEFWSGPTDPLLAILREQHGKTTRRIDWMLRVVDVVDALQARGYPAGLSAELDLEVQDDLIAENNGRFMLTLDRGRAAVREGGDGSMLIDIRGLASLYAGHFTPQALKIIGKLDADDETLTTAGDIFAGPAPWMPDMF